MQSTTALIISALFFADTTHASFQLLSRQMCSASVNCDSLSASDCIKALCEACGPSFPAIQECCSAANTDAMETCVNQAMIDIGNGIATFSSAASSQDISIAETTSTAPTSSSTTSMDPCSAVQISSAYCDLATPGFSLISDFSSQASCLCYRYQSFDPAGFDVPFAACATEYAGYQGNQTVVKKGLYPRTIAATNTAPCSSAGAVRGYTTPSMPVAATVTITGAGAKASSCISKVVWGLSTVSVLALLFL